MLKRYEKSFWVFVGLMIIITTIIMVINNYTTVSVKELSEDAEEHIAGIETELVNIRQELDQYQKIVNQFAEADENTELLETEIMVLMTALEKNNNSLDPAAYYHAGNEADTGRYGSWRKVIQSKSDKEQFVYARPIYTDEQYVGEIGVLVSYTKIQSSLEQIKGDESWTYGIFVNEQEAVQFQAAESENGVCTYKELGAGMVYIEVHDSLKRTKYSNDMILLISLFAVGAMWMIQRSKKTGQTVFDKISAFVMKDYEARIDSTKRQGNKATIALNIGMAIAIFGDVIYSVALGRDIKVLLEYFLFYLFSSGIVFLYKYSKFGITEGMAMTIISLGFIGPMAEHISSGGFYGGRAGESFLWFLICIYYGLFILGTERGRNFFQVYVVFFFLDVVLETVMFRKNNYEENYLFASGFILLGFALYIAMEIYVSGAAGHYNRTKELIDELNQNQRLLMRKEKMSALGQLISGVSYEINTPIGAIKASAETMDSLFLPMLEEALDAAEVFSAEQYHAFVEIAVETMKATGKMRNTGEIRRAKKEIAGYFEEQGLKDGKQIANLLGQLEIIDMDWIQEHMATMEMNGILNVLERVTKLTAFTSGIPITIYSSDMVSKLVLALKSYVHIGEGGESPEFDIIKNIETVLILYHNELKGNIQVIKKYQREKMRIIGNPSEFSQVWTNLIHNAIQAMKNGGELTIEVTEEANNTVKIMIKDTGEGILPELLPKIYEPFFSTRPSGEGSGLGLNITSKIIKKHGGALQVESQPGVGTSVIIHLKKSEVQVS